MDLGDVQSWEQANELFRRGLERGTTRVFTVCSELGIDQLPELVSLRKSLAGYRINVDELQDPKFYRVNIAARCKLEQELEIELKIVANILEQQ